MSVESKPYTIKFFSNGSNSTGYVSVAEFDEQIPFPIQRLYWIYGFEGEATRGNHAYRKGEQVLVSMAGEALLTLESPLGEIFEYHLTSSDMGVYIPGTYWRKVKVDKGGVILCISSHKFDPENYVKDYAIFKNRIV